MTILNNLRASFVYTSSKKVYSIAEEMLSYYLKEGKKQLL